MSSRLDYDPETRYPLSKTERMKLLDEMIAAGWGSTPQRLIPRNWREVRGPYIEDEEDSEVPDRIDNMREDGIEHRRSAVA